MIALYIYIYLTQLHNANNKTLDIKVVMQNKSFNCVILTKFLGIIIDNNFKWNEHIVYVKN